MKLISSLIILVSLSGCASYNTTLTRADGKQYHCVASGYGIIGSIITSSRHEECVKRAKEKGYEQNS